MHTLSLWRIARSGVLTGWPSAEMWKYYCHWSWLQKCFAQQCVFLCFKTKLREPSTVRWQNELCIISYLNRHKRFFSSSVTDESLLHWIDHNAALKSFVLIGFQFDVSSSDYLLRPDKNRKLFSANNKIKKTKTKKQSIQLWSLCSH